MKFVAFAIAAAATVVPAAAQTISVHPGETVTVRFENGNAVVEKMRQAELITKYEIYELWRAETQNLPPGARFVPPGFVTEGEGPPSPPRPSGDTLQITMRRVPAIKPGSPDNAALFLSNGYGSTLRYRAVMRSGGQSVATDVCDVPPHLLGLEHWPYPIDQLDLTDFRLVETNGTMQCQ
jgi:hypothetical protein